MPRILVPPGFGISTIRTGPGKYDPDDMRFHSLYRLPVRFPSNCSIVTPSGPAAPPFSLIFSQASHTSIFGMSYDLPCNLGSLTRLIPLGLTAFINQDGPSPWLHPHYRASQLLRDGPPACPDRYSAPHGFSRSGSSLSPPVGVTSGRYLHTFHTRAWTGLMLPVCRTPPGQ